MSIHIILYKDGTKIEAVRSCSQQTESSKESYNKGYFVVQNNIIWNILI